MLIYYDPTESLTKNLDTAVQTKHLMTTAGDRFTVSLLSPSGMPLPAVGAVQVASENGRNYVSPKSIAPEAIPIYRQISDISLTKSQNFKRFSSHLAVVFAQSIEAKCEVENVYICCWSSTDR